MSKSRRTSDLVNSLLVNADNSVNIHEGTQSPYFQLDTTATPTLLPGMFGWNDAYGTADLRLKGGNVTLQLGQETLARVVNKTGADLLESQYKVVRVRVASEGGSQGQRLAVVLAQGNNDPDSVTTLGIVTENIANNQEGFITVFGNVNGINTTGSLQGETWVDGDVLFLSPTTPGSLTNVKPQAPNHTVVMGYVIYAHGVNGKIFVKVDNGYEIDELHNVKINSVAGNDLLQYDSTLQVWKNVAASVAVPTPTLAQVTTAGNTTTNAITVGAITGNIGSISQFKFNAGAGSATPTIAVGNLDTGGKFAALLAGTSGSEFNFDNSGWFAIAGDSKSNYNSNNLGSGSETYYLRVNGSTGNVQINTTTDAGYKLDVNGTGRYVGSLNIWRNTTTNGFVLSSGSNDTLQWNNGTWDIQFNSGTPVTILRLSNGVGGVSYLTSKININAPNVISNLGASLGVYGNIITSGSITAASAVARGVYFNNTLVAAANNDVLVGLDINPTFTNGAFTGVQNWGLRVQNSNILLSTTKGIYFGNSGYGITGEVGTGSLSFYTNSTERLRVDNSGSFMINATSRTYGASGGYMFGVKGTTTQAAISIARSTQALDSQGMVLGLDASAGYIILRDNIGLAILTNDDERLRIHADGNVSINTIANAGYKLQVIGNTSFSSGTDTYNYITSTSTGSAGTIYTNTYHSFFTGTNYATANSWEVYDLTSSASRIWISGPTGNIGINKTTATYKLDVEGDIRSTTYAFFATTSGSVGIGTTTPASKLDVVGDINVSGVFAVGGVGGWTGTINIPTNPPGQQNIQVAGGIIVNVS